VKRSAALLIVVLAMAMIAGGLSACSSDSNQGAAPAVDQDTGNAMSQNEAAVDTSEEGGQANEMAGQNETGQNEAGQNVTGQNEAGQNVTEGETTDDESMADEAGDEAAAPMVKLNLNTATLEELAALPGVGETLADEFVEYRPYVSIAEFRSELAKYVDEAEVTTFELYVFVPVSPNDSDTDTLMQLPGVDGTIAAELEAGRPYESVADFITALSALVTPDDAAAAEDYLVEE